jgi:autotransporter-associated beta strand protein
MPAALVLIASATIPALADPVVTASQQGGNGGNGDYGFPPGIGGTYGNPGGTGGGLHSFERQTGGGGGGGGANAAGGAGGIDGFGNAGGGAGTAGVAPGGSGGLGGGGISGSGGGGGGGGGDGETTVSGYNNTVTLTGGTGGNGGDGGNRGFDNGIGGGGGGGAGGFGLVITGNGTSSTNSGAINGGTGGIGGAGVRGGNGGDGGVGVYIPNSGTIINSVNATILGGNGGAGGTQEDDELAHETGSQGTGPGAVGAGGAGIVGNQIAIINSGSITGGTGNGGQANAITFTGGSNSLTENGTGLSGNLGLATGVGTVLTFVQTTENGGTGNAVISNNITGVTGGSTDASLIITTDGGYAVSLGGTNTYSGGTTVTVDSRLGVQSSSALGSGTLALNPGATFILDGSVNGSLNITNNITVAGDPIFTTDPVNPMTISGQITDAAGPTPGDVVVNGGGVLTLSGQNTYSLGTTISGTGTTVVVTNSNPGTSSSIGTGPLTFDGGILQVQSGAGPLSFNNSVAINSTGGTFDTNGTTLTWTGVIADAPTQTGALTVADTAGGGTLILTNTNTYTGATTINGGTLALSGTGSISGSSGVALATGGAFDISGLTNGGTSITTLGDTAAGQAGNVALGANTLTITNGSTTFSGVIDDAGQGGGLTVSGGTQTLAGANTYSGATTINGGTLALSGNGSISSSSGVALATGGAFDISGLTNGGTSITTLGDSAVGQAGNVALGANTLTLSNASSTFSGAINGSGGLRVAGGTETLTGINTYSGATTVDPGATLVVDGGKITQTSGITDNGTLTIQNAGTVSESGGVSLGSVAGTSNLTITGPGSTLTLYSNNNNNIDIGEVAGGNGTMTISNGGQVLGTSDAIIGNIANETSSVTVTGAGSSWSFNHQLIVGNNGTGTLTISNGGTVTSADTYFDAFSTIGAASNSSGTVTVTGTGSSYTTNDSHLYVGLDGTGTLTVVAGGNVSVQGGSGTIDVAINSDATGTLNIGAAAGQTAVAPGTISAAQILFGAGNGSIVFNHTSTNYQFTTQINGPGSVDVENGTTVFTASNGYTGATTINGGTLALSGTGSISGSSGVVLASDGTFDISGLTNGGTSIRTLGDTAAGQAGNVALGPNTLTITNGATTFSGVIGDAGLGGGLTVAGGTQTLASANTYTGATTINNGGTLSLSGTGSIASSSGVIDNGTFDISQAAPFVAIKTLSGSGNVALGFNNLSITAGSTEFSGVIAGFGGLVMYGGTQTLSGINTYSFLTQIIGGTLALSNTGSISLSSGVVLATGGTFDISGLTNGGTSITTLGTTSAGQTGTVTLGANRLTLSNANGTFGGAINGSGGLTLTAGTEILSGTSGYTGTTTVNGGALDVEGSIASSSQTTVNASGLLTGTGAVGATTIANGGTFLPGNGTPGSFMTVNGNLVFQPGALYLVQLDTAASSFANVTGTATLNGILGATFASGSYVAKQYTILTATLGRSGTFSSFNTLGLPAGFAAGVSYDPTHAYLNLALNYAAASGLNGNQQNVGNALSSFFNATGGIPAVFGGLSPGGLTQAAGESGTGSMQASFDAANQFLNLMLDAYIDSRGGDTAEGGALGYASTRKSPAASRDSKANDAYAAVTPRDRRAAMFDARWSVWASGYGGSSTVAGDAGAGTHSTTSRIYGSAVGTDYRISPNTLVGFALGGAGFNFGLSDGLGGGRAELFQAGVFGRHIMGAAYVSAALAYGWQDVTTDRIVTIAGTDNLHANFKASTLAARGEAGYRFATALGGLTPYAALQATSFMLPGYGETATSGSNQFALTYASQTTTDVRSELGARADKSFLMPDGVFTLRGRAAWAHDSNTNRPINATFQTLPGASFTVNGAQASPNSALVTTGAEMKWRNGISLAGTFEGEFSHTTQSYAGKGTVRYAW